MSAPWLFERRNSRKVTDWVCEADGFQFTKKNVNSNQETVLVEVTVLATGAVGQVQKQLGDRRYAVLLASGEEAEFDGHELDFGELLVSL